MKTITKWKEGMTFESHLNHHTINIDTTTKGGGADTGFNPKALLLSALAGCTAMDVVSLLVKMRIKFSNFEIEVDADQTDEEPRVFKDFNIIYRVKTATSNKDKVKKAVDLSLDKYCGVSAMLKKHAAIYYKIIIEE
jgi:putative redox protein